MKDYKIKTLTQEDIDEILRDVHLYKWIDIDEHNKQIKLENRRDVKN